MSVPVPVRSSVHRWGWQPALFPAAAPLFVLGAQGSAGLPLASLVVGVALAAAWVTRHPRLARFDGLGWVALLGSAAGLASVAPFSLTTALVAGLVGLTSLLWIASAGPPRRALQAVAPGLLLPTIGLLVALAASVALPVGRQYAGVAGALLVAALLAVTYLLATTGRHPTEGPLPS